jgi:hypothetical protein
MFRVFIGMDLAGIAQMDSRVGSRKHVELERARPGADGSPCRE